MNRSYNHIKHLTDNIKVERSKIHRGNGLKRTWPQDCDKHHANQLDDEQGHTGFDYYEYDMPKFGTPS